MADDSEASLRGVGRVLEELTTQREPLEVDLLNVQTPVRGDVSTFIEEQAIKDMHHEQGLKALHPPATCSNARASRMSCISASATSRM